MSGIRKNNIFINREHKKNTFKLWDVIVVKINPPII